MDDLKVCYQLDGLHHQFSTWDGLGAQKTFAVSGEI